MSGLVGVALGGSDALGIPSTQVGRTLILQLGNRILDLDDYDENGFIINTIDLGYPVPRAAGTDLPNQDGQFDQTQFSGPRTVSIGGYAVDSAAGSRGKAADLLAPFLAPNARPQLIYALDDDAELKVLNLRVSQWTAPVTHGAPSSTTGSLWSTVWQVQWVAPDPIPLSVLSNEVDIGTGADAGITFPVTFPVTFPPSTSADNIGVLAIGGTYATWPTLRLFGPITDPIVEYLDPDTLIPSGPVVAFTGLTVNAGDYLEIDPKAQSVLLNGDPNASRFSFVDFPNTEFGPVDPGMIAVRFSGNATNPSTLLAVIWQNAWIQ